MSRPGVAVLPWATPLLSALMTKKSLPVTQHSVLAMHRWEFWPGRRAMLRYANDDVVAVIVSSEIGKHVWMQEDREFTTLHDAMRAVEDVRRRTIFTGGSS